MTIKRPVTDFEIQTHRDKNDQVFVHSRYEFLRKHNGIRPDSLHLLMATTGAGKSTLAKCIAAEVAAHFKILIWLSEETVEEYQELIHEMDKSVLSNIFFVEEKEIEEQFKENQKDFFEYFEQMVEEVDPFMILIDNATTSAFYNQRFSLWGQNKAAEFLKDFPKRTGKAILCVAHTDSKVTDNFNKVVSPENIRGSKELALNAEYLYIIQKFTSNAKIYNLLRVAKFRHHKEAAGWYALTFEQNAYVGDSEVPFSLVNKIFKSRDYLGRADKTKKKDD